MDTTYLDKIFDFQGRTVWVFGGAGYLGGPAVYALARAGARVLCVDVPGASEKMIEQIGHADRILPATVDAFDIEATRSFVREHIKKLGVPDGLFNLTTGSSGKAMADITPEIFDQTNHRSLTCAFDLAHTVGTQMVDKGRGSIVLTSSMYGIIAPNPAAYKAPMAPNPIDYGACKAGVQAMARYFAAMWGKHGVRCNSVSPGPFPKSHHQEQHPDFIVRLAAQNPSARVGRREEIAGPAVFLLSDAASYVNGQDLAADGGWTCW